MDTQALSALVLALTRSGAKQWQNAGATRQCKSGVGTSLGDADEVVNCLGNAVADDEQQCFTPRAIIARGSTAALKLRNFPFRLLTLPRKHTDTGWNNESGSRVESTTPT
jgi:hypothetical protein